MPELFQKFRFATPSPEEGPKGWVAESASSKRAPVIFGLLSWVQVRIFSVRAWKVFLIVQHDVSALQTLAYLHIFSLLPFMSISETEDPPCAHAIKPTL